MKKLLLLFVVFCSTIVANAQFDFAFGPKVGYQTAKLSVDGQTIESDFNSNMTLGVFCRAKFNKFIVQPELLYCKSNNIMEINMSDANNSRLLLENPTFNVSKNNLMFPVFLGGQLADFDFLKIRANVGPVFYFPVGETVCTSNISDEVIRIKESLSEGITMSAAFNLGLDIWRFTFDVGYCLCLTETIDDDIELPFDIKIGDDVKQNVFIVSLGFKFL